MGVWASKMVQWIWSGFEDDPARIVMLGLDSAGKTTILYKVKLNDVITTIPTIGFNVEAVDVGKGVRFTVWDVGGQKSIQPLWRHYFQNTQGLIFVVDSSDRERFGEASEALGNILNNDEMQGVPFVVMANKQDMPGACSSAELADVLRLSSYRTRDWYIQSTCAKTGEGLFEGMFKMGDMVRQYKRNTQH